jgi:hypothetical protein
MSRGQWLVTILWFVLGAAGGTVGALLISDGKGAGSIVVGVLFSLVLAALVWRKTYRWVQHDQERWRARYRQKRAERRLRLEAQRAAPGLAPRRPPPGGTSSATAIRAAARKDACADQTSGTVYASAVEERSEESWL